MSDNDRVGDHCAADSKPNGAETPDTHDRWDRPAAERRSDNDAAIPARETPPESIPVKTSAASVFAVVLGVIGLCAVVGVVFAPIGVIVGIIGIIVAIIGMRKTRGYVLVGHAVAVSGLVLSIIALVLSILELLGVATFVGTPAWSDWMSQLNP